MSSVVFEVSAGEVRLLDTYSHGAGGPCTALVLIFIFAVPLNVTTIIVVLRTFLRAHIFNLLIAAFLLALLLDAAVNIPFYIVFRSSWVQLVNWMGVSAIWLCRFNAGFVIWTNILQVCSLALLIAHRLSAMTDKSPKVKRFFWLTALTWGASSSITAPVVAGVQNVAYFDERYSCSLVNVTSQTSTAAAAVTMYTIGFALPYILLIGLWLMLTVRIVQERQRVLKKEMLAMQRAVATGSPIRGFGSSSGSSTNWLVWDTEDENAGNGRKFIILLALLTSLHLFLVLPQLASNISTAFLYPDQTHPYQALLVDMIFRPVATPWYDATFTWLRIANTIIAPCVILISHDPLRRQTIEMFFSCQRNKYSQLSPAPGLGHLRAGKKRKKSKNLKAQGHVVPILFVTNEGIHFRRARPNPSQTNIPIIFNDLGLQLKGSKTNKLLDLPTKRLVGKDIKIIEEDEIAKKPKKGGKSVRFSQNISEIPPGSYVPDPSMMGGKVSVDDNTPFEPLAAILESKTEIREVEDVPRWVPKRRGSEATVNFRKNGRSLELDLADNSLGSSSSSLILSLSQRMRNRDV